MSAGPDGTSGTAAGGTGGGWSLNIWALAGAIWMAIGTTARASHSPTLRRNPKIPPPPDVMVMLFTGNAANSSRPVPSDTGGVGTLMDTND